MEAQRGRVACRSVEETEALVIGVERCGGGKWADIKKLGFPVIAQRSAVDLKDKWRNLMRVALLPGTAAKCAPPPAPPPLPYGRAVLLRADFTALFFVRQQEGSQGRVGSQECYSRGAKGIPEVVPFHALVCGSLSDGLLLLHS